MSDTEDEPITLKMRNARIAQCKRTSWAITGPFHPLAPVNKVR